MNPKFYIFGVPNGFDILDASDMSGYFQTFYNGSRENTKFVIHRDVSNRYITYTYLKYNLTSAKGREGSFIGITLYFRENAYCLDIQKLYNLFDFIFEEKIIKEKKIVKPTDGSSHIQAIYQIEQFSQVRDYIYEIESIFVNNLNQLFNDKFISLNGVSNPQGEENGICIPIETSNEEICKLIKLYNRISISPEYKKAEDKTIPIELLQSYHSNIQRYSMHLNQCFSANKTEISKRDIKQVVEKLGYIIQTLNGKTPIKGNVDSEKKYEECKLGYQQLYKSYNKLLRDLETYPSPESIGTTGTENDNEDENISIGEKTKNKVFLKIGIAIASLLILVYIIVSIISIAPKEIVDSKEIDSVPPTFPQPVCLVDVDFNESNIDFGNIIVNNTEEKTISYELIKKHCYGNDYFRCKVDFIGNHDYFEIIDHNEQEQQIRIKFAPKRAGTYKTKLQVSSMNGKSSMINIQAKAKAKAKATSNSSNSHSHTNNTAKPYIIQIWGEVTSNTLNTAMGSEERIYKTIDAKDGTHEIPVNEYKNYFAIRMTRNGTSAGINALDALTPKSSYTERYGYAIIDMKDKTEIKLTFNPQSSGQKITIKFIRRE